MHAHFSQLVGRPTRRVNGNAHNSHIGGWPIRFDQSKWPVCRQCGQKLGFVLQLDLHRHLKLSKKYQWAYLFTCLNEDKCQTYHGEDGANQLVLANESEAGESRNLVSGSLPQFDLEFAPYSPPSDDYVGARTPLDVDRVKELPSLPRDDSGGVMVPDHWLQTDASDTVIIGGAPRWLQDEWNLSCPKCHREMVFTGQIDSEVKTQANDKYWLPFCGIGYMFRCASECDPLGTYFGWQTT